MSERWPEVTLALVLVLAVAYAVAEAVTRVADTVLRNLLPDDRERTFVDRPKSLVRLLIFLVTASALSFPALRLAGVQTEIGGSPEALGRWLLRGGLRIAVIAIAAYMVVRVGSAAAQRFEREMSVGTGLDVVERTKRAQTLGRLLQKTLSVLVIGIAGLMILRELDVDITPVLTGAGIVGLAVGFGAQTLVRDVISGFFLILENQVRVGDVALVNGLSGLVEAVNLRTMVLRSEDGTVHVIPNGEIKTLSNLTKDFSFYVFSIGVARDTDPDDVVAAVVEAGAALQEDPEYQPHVLAPVEVYGVDDFQQGQIVIKSRIKTVPLKQWFVGRGLRKRIASTFHVRGIDLPVPEMNVRIDGLEDLLGARDDQRHGPRTHTDGPQRHTDTEG